MKIKLRIKECAVKHGIRTAYQLQKAAGLSPSNAAKLFRNASALISLETLGCLCEALSCEPKDLFHLHSSRRKRADKQSLDKDD